MGLWGNGVWSMECVDGGNGGWGMDMGMGMVC